ncbi:Branched-chain amino acid transport protein [Poseidonocella pacifica]|uniref:Branched-chain amino acid transport protein n=1 Tax=Poseidonocella pacifica TaxID=871651 RepID=A0A1I0XIV6_9RHOB|nr:AzlD domain-containing protein [Poseidonocella pacifica]SFA99893.1 Branched-chain amino acid transport protein [Poseidonocella pacifica]
MIDRLDLWIVIVGLGLGSFLLRFAFLGLVGGRELPAWLSRHLRYTAVAVLPALIAPLILWPGATDGQIDPARLSASAVTIGVGLWTKNVLLSIACGAVTLYGMLYLLG